MNLHNFKNVSDSTNADTQNQYQPRVNPYHRQIRGASIYDNSYLRNPLLPEPEPEEEEPSKKKKSPKRI